MKIAISSQGEKLDSPIDPRFGRARYLIFYDTDNDSWEALDNQQNMQAAHGAGVQTAQSVANRKVEMVISGNFGPKAGQILGAAGIKTATWADGTVNEAVEKVKNNQLGAPAQPGS